MVALRAADVMGTLPYQRKQLEEVLFRGLRLTQLSPLELSRAATASACNSGFVTSPGENSK